MMRKARKKERKKSLEKSSSGIYQTTKVKGKSNKFVSLLKRTFTKRNKETLTSSSGNKEIERHDSCDGVSVAAPSSSLSPLTSFHDNESDIISSKKDSTEKYTNVLPACINQTLVLNNTPDQDHRTKNLDCSLITVGIDIIS